MRATGILRRVDDLGRVVIPKEVRRSLGIREGDPMEIYTIDGGVVFKKYHHNLVNDVRSIREVAEDYFEGEDKYELLQLLERAQKILEKDEE